MKNSKEYAKTIKKLFNSLKRRGPKAKKVVYDDPVEAVIYGIISERMNASAAKSAMKRVKESFVDFNDLRVSRKEEVFEVLGGDDADFQEMVSSLKRVLGAIYNKYDKVSLEDLLDMGKKQGKKELEELEINSGFVVNYCFLTALGGHSIPLTQKMVDYLKANELVHPEAAAADTAGFLERQITSVNGYNFYSLLRRESESSAKAKKKTVKKAAKKKVSKKKTVKKVKKASSKTSKSKKRKKS